MQIRYVKPRAELAAYIERLWVLESAAGLPAGKTNVVPPNGCAKLAIPVLNTREFKRLTGFPPRRYMRAIDSGFCRRIASR